MSSLSRQVVTLAAALGVAACNDTPTSLTPHPAPVAGDVTLDAQVMAAVPISTGGTGWQASAAIDGAGNSIAVWVQRTTSDGLWSKSRPPNGQWGSPSVIAGSVGTSAEPVVHVTAAGMATTVWTDFGGVWTADRSAAGVWGPARLILPGVKDPVFVMNSQGDAAVLWSSGSGGPTQVNAIRRKAGGPWGASEVVAAGSFVQFEHAAIAENTGDVVVTWESFTAPCFPYCLNNFVVHVSRAAKGSSTWQDSGPLTSPAPTGHDAYPTIDAAGHAAVVYLGGQGLVSSNQAAAGAGWSPPAAVYSSQSLRVSGIAVDLAGHATVALLDLARSKVIAISGSVVNNSWGTPVAVSASDQSPSLVVFALGNGGAAVVAWSSGNPNGSSQVRVAVRANSGGAWSSPRTISPPGLYYGTAESAAVNASGKGIVIFSAYTDATLSVHTEWATNN